MTSCNKYKRLLKALEEVGFVLVSENEWQLFDSSFKLTLRKWSKQSDKFTITEVTTGGVLNQEVVEGFNSIRKYLVERGKMRIKNVDRDSVDSPHKHHHLDSIQKRIYKMDTSDMTIKQLVDMFGCSRSHISHILRRFNKSHVKVDRSKLNRKYNWDKIADDDWRKMTNQEIAERLAIPSVDYVVNMRHRRKKKMTHLRLKEGKYWSVPFMPCLALRYPIAKCKKESKEIDL